MVSKTESLEETDPPVIVANCDAWDNKQKIRR